MTSKTVLAPNDASHDSAIFTEKPVIYRDFAKRAMDILLVTVTAPITLTIVALFALLVLLTGARPFFTQSRVGRNGELFKMWKLRSMVEDADARLAAYLESNPEAKTEWDRTQKLQNDPRITSLGRFLRKTSIDELPQLWNVFTGDMSIVGPRPMMPCQRSMYPSDSYYRMRPGITGYWQIAGRHRTAFSARAEFDDKYEREMSFTTDIRVLAKTVGVVMNARGC